MVENIEALADGSAFDSNSIDGDILLNSSVEGTKIDYTTLQMYSFSATNNVNRTLTGGSENKMTWSTEEYDYGSAFDLGNSRYIAPVKGVYHFDSSINTPSGVSESLRMLFFVNGNRRRAGAVTTFTSGGQVEAESISSDIFLNANDYVEVFIYSDDNSNTSGNAQYNWFTGHLVQAVS